MRLDGKNGILSDRSVEMHYSLIHKILNRAVKWEIIDKNRCSNVEVPHPKYKKINVHDEPEMAKFLHLVDQLPDRYFKYRVITHLAFSLGLRREENRRTNLETGQFQEWVAGNIASIVIHCRKTTKIESSQK